MAYPRIAAAPPPPEYPTQKTYNAPGNVIIIIGAIFIPLNILAVALRLWARHMKKTSLKVTDYLIIIALFLNFANYGTGIDFAVNGAIGLPIQKATADEIVTALKVRTDNDLIAQIYEYVYTDRL